MYGLEKILSSYDNDKINIYKSYKIFDELKVGIENLFEKYDEKDFDFVLSCSRLILDNIENK